MKTNLSLKRRFTIILLALVLAMPLWASLGRNTTTRVARGAAEPLAVAVNWNSFAIGLPSDG